MTSAHRRYLLVDYGAVPFVVNTLLNAGIAWLFFGGLSVVPLWGAQSIGVDALITCFLLPCIACLIVTPLVRADVRHGRQLPLTTATGSSATGLGARLARWTPSARRRAVITGTIGLAIAGPATIVALTAAGIASLDLKPFLLFKGLHAGALAAGCIPFFAAAALRDGALRDAATRPDATAAKNT